MEVVVEVVVEAKDVAEVVVVVEGDEAPTLPPALHSSTSPQLPGLATQNGSTRSTSAGSAFGH